MSNPYHGRPDYTYWKRSISDVDPNDIDLVTSVPFQIGRDERVATAGSCFAQHIAQTLQRQGFNYFRAEAYDPSGAGRDENFGVFSARFGNIYTTRQLIQLFGRAYGLFHPHDQAWITKAGKVLDPFRPHIQSEGFGTVEALAVDRTAHLAAVRRMFEDTDIFIFTLGLTETWLSKIDGAAFPLAPGVVGADVDFDDYEFRNLTVAEMENDLSTFLRRLQSVNPGVRVILTVSPVPLIATFEDRHVVLSTELSKAALRVVADTASKHQDKIAYFPSYEIITSHFNGGSYFAADMRSVSPDGVAKVMKVFSHHFMTNQSIVPAARKITSRPKRKTSRERNESIMEHEKLVNIVCDEEAIVQ